MYPIPANATRLRYLEINGDGAYINTGVTPQNSPSATIRAQYLGTSQSSAQTTPLFGRRDFSSPNKLFAFWVRSDTLKMAVNWGTYDTGWKSQTTDKTAFHDFGLNSSGGYFDGTNFASVSSGGSIGAWTGTPVHIGAVCQSNAGEDLVTRGVKLRIASFRLWNNSGADLAFDGIPVRVGTVGYLFDRVSGQLFGNAGTGDFVLGPDTFQQGVVPTRMCVMGVRKKPYDAEVEWLSCYVDGRPASYVSAGYNSGDTVGFDVDITRVNNITGDNVAFGVRWNSGDSRWFVGAQSNGKYYWGWNGRIDSQTLVLNARHTLGLNFLNSRAASFDGVSVGSLSGSYTYNIPLFFPAYYQPTWESPMGAASWRVHRGRISVGSTIVRDFIPVRIGSAGAWYDRVTNTLFKNEGSVPFVVGPDKT